MMQRYAVHAPILVGLGYDTTPLIGKKPILEGWQKRPDAALDFDKYNGKNIGVLCGGRSHLVALDVDIYDQRIAQQFGEIITEELGFAPQRVGMAPKTLFVFRCTESVPKMRTAIFHIKGKDCAVEILAEGQQFVASGIHPDTNKKYKWVDDTLADIPVDKLTAVTPDQLREFVAMSNTMLSKHGKPKGRKANGTPQQLDWFATQELSGEIKEIDVALAHIPNDDWHYEDWVKMALSLKGAVAEDGYDLWHRFSQRSNKYDERETDRVWKSIKDVKAVGAGSIFYMARDYGFDVGEFRREEKKASVKVEIIQGLFTPWSDITSGNGADDFVEDVLGSGQMSVLYGDSNTGKTFFVLDLCVHVAFGWKWNGYECDQGGVIYAALEGAHGIRNRIAAVKQHFSDEIGGEVPDFDTITTNLDLLAEDGDTQMLIAAINERQKTFSRPLRLIVIDTLARAIAGGDENKSESMGQLVVHADAIRKETGAHVLFVHHSGKDQARGARGHSSLRAATDTEIEVVRDNDATISSAKVTKQREFEGGQQWHFKLHHVELGMNKRSKMFGSCVVMAANDEEIATIKTPKMKLTDNQALVVSTLENLIKEHGYKREGYDRSSVYLEQLCGELEGRFNEKRAANNQAIMRVLNSQKLKNTVTVQGKLVWIV